MTAIIGESSMGVRERKKSFGEKLSSLKQPHRTDIALHMGLYSNIW